MKSVLFSRLLAFAVAAAGLGAPAALAQAQAPATHALEGKWGGTLSLASDRLPVVVEIERKADGRLSGTVTGLDQDNPFAIDAVEQNGAAVRLVVGAASGGFEGTLSADGAKLSGAWSQLAIATPLELVRTSSARPAQPSQ